ncbi:hypothetical protein LGR54_15775 [Ancylobacter sp. Lp-2]|uniref:hypothetical protein n=1 Tax=Ancylobacter sp. Lp-2 TaxID=2881339 RepID=UPI001E421C11|nr:hypothetical protein [Ancylobacter sp. Lp-2]MCB4770076.1 hypothetical protein [Ancylobacter sp. Lp-2]
MRLLPRFAKVFAAALAGGFAMWWLFETFSPSTNTQPYQVVIYAVALAGASLFWGSRSASRG